jgi:Xaa-Pro aminopeptidase
MNRLLADTISTATGTTEWTAIDAMLHTLERAKDPDELALIRTAIRCDLAAYDAVQKVITPGINELEVLAVGAAAAQAAAGERVTHDGGYGLGDGGMGSDRSIQAGEMYVIDAWSNYRGYWADLCRVFSVDNKPTDVQQSVYDHVLKTHRTVAKTFKPGVRGTEISRQVDQMLREHPVLRETGLIHHAGHGCGLRAHMEPDLNAMREGILAEGDVICFEPGGYSEKDGVNVRIEDMYLITRDGAENLTNYPCSLVRP